MARIFVVDQREMPDPDPSLPIEQVQRLFSDFFPELASATFTQTPRGDDTVVVFDRSVGTKG